MTGYTSALTRIIVMTTADLEQIRWYWYCLRDAAFRRSSGLQALLITARSISAEPISIKVREDQNGNLFAFLTLDFQVSGTEL